MATVVRVDPLDMMPYVFAALGNGNVDCLEVPSMENGKKFEIYFKGNPSCGEGEKKSLVSFGEFDWDSNTAFRGALVASLVAIREGFNIYVGDYSYTKMVNKHRLFAKVQEKLKGRRDSFYALAGAARAFLSTCFGIIKDISNHFRQLPWIQSNCTTMSSKVRQLTQQLKRSQCAVQMSAQCGNIASDPISFFEDVAPPMEFNAEASFFLLRDIFEKAMKIVNGSIPHVATALISDGIFQSHFFLDAGAVPFYGDRCNSEFAAKSDVMLKGLRHLEENLKVEIRDLTFDMWCVMMQKIDSFDAEMGFLAVHADGVKQSVMSCFDTFGDQIAMLQSVVTSLMADERCFDGLRRAIHTLSQNKDQIEAAYADFCACKSTLDDLQVN